MGFRGVGVACCVFFIVAGCTLVDWTHWVREFGVNIPTDDVVQDYWEGLLWAVALGVTIFFWRVHSSDKPHILVGWMIKATMCLVGLLPYERLYATVDGFGYFSMSEHFTFEPGSLSLGLGYSVMYALGRLHRMIGPASYHAMKVTFGFVGLIAVYVFYLAACQAFQRRRVSFFYTLLLIPSILLWSSILGKEPVILLGIAMSALGVARIARQSTLRAGPLIICGIAIVAVVRIWVGTLLAIASLFVLLVQSKITLKWLATICVLSIAAIVLGVTTQDRLTLSEAESPIDVYANIDRSWGRVNSRLDVDVDFSDMSSVLKFVPLGCLIALYSPLPWQAHNFPSALASVESCIVLLLTILAVLKVRRRHWGDRLFIWGALLVLMWTIVYSLIAFRDLGTAVRFRVQIIPVLVGLFYLVICGKPPASEMRRNVID